MECQKITVFMFSVFQLDFYRVEVTCSNPLILLPRNYQGLQLGPLQVNWDSHCWIE